MKQLVFRLLCLTIVSILLALPASAEENCIITGTSVRFRSSPKIDIDNILGKLNPQDEITFLAQEGDWVKIQHQGIIGYVHADYVQHITFPDYTAFSGITTTDVNLRADPSTKNPAIMVLSSGTMVSVLQQEEQWIQVNVAGTTGYLFAKYVEVIPIQGIILGTYTTSFSTSQKGRSYNIEKAAQLIQGTVIAPGESFSLLTAIGPITQAGGYQEAPEFKQTANGVETVTGYGGGVCQVATTLYQSVCTTKQYGCRLEILERHRHSKKVSYVPEGKDATISWNAEQDFRFQNSNYYSVKIVTYVKQGKITCFIVKV